MSKGSVRADEYMEQAQSLANEIQSGIKLNKQFHALNNPVDTVPTGPALISISRKNLNTPEQTTVSDEEKIETAVFFVFSGADTGNQLAGKLL